jgi:hypothetical protein
VPQQHGGDPDHSAVIEALGFAGNPLSQAGREWLGGLGPVQEDTVGPGPDSPVLGWAGTRPFGPAEHRRLRQVSKLLNAKITMDWQLS